MNQEPLPTIPPMDCTERVWRSYVADALTRINHTIDEKRSHVWTIRFTIGAAGVGVITTISKVVDFLLSLT